MLMKRKEVLRRYRNLRAICTRHHSAAVKFLAQPAILESARRLGLTAGHVLIADSTEELTLVFDLAIYTAKEGRTLGLDYPLVTEQLAKWRTIPPERLGACVRPEGGERAVVCWWFVEAATPQGERKTQVLALAATEAGRRAMTLERLAERLLDRPPSVGFLDVTTRHRFMIEVVEPVLHRELDHRGLLAAGGSIAAELLAWLEVGQ
jgi:hypothetical protein